MQARKVAPLQKELAKVQPHIFCSGAVTPSRGLATMKNLAKLVTMLPINHPRLGNKGSIKAGTNIGHRPCPRLTPPPLGALVEKKAPFERVFGQHDDDNHDGPLLLW